jgi:XTP/dITP diphosphohydrolase
MRRVLLATTNAGKLREIRDILGDAGFELVSLADLPPVNAPEETGATFQENARLKALHYAAHTPLVTIAEDSGLVVDALDGEPGVRSARFLRDDATYPERFAEILRRLGTRASGARTARFLCAAAVARGTQVLFETVGAIEGEIALKPRGTNGFGYDPIFYYPPYGRTLAEVSQREKLMVAHRGRAFRAVRGWLVEHGHER